MQKLLYPFVRFSRIIDSFPPKACIAYDFRLFLCTAGKGDIEIGKQHLMLKKNTMIYIPAGVPYRYIPDKAAPFRFIGFNFDFYNPRQENPIPIPPAVPESFLPEKLPEPDFKEKPFDIPFTLTVTETMLKFFYEINREFEQKKIFYEHFCASKLLELLYCIIRAKSLASEAHPDRINDILIYIKEHSRENFSNSELGYRFGYHKNYISRLILRSTGLPLHRYLIQCRLDNAIGMLHDTDMSISEISDAAGFPDISAFSNCFKKYIGISPSEYKKHTKYH